MGKTKNKGSFVAIEHRCLIEDILLMIKFLDDGESYKLRNTVYKETILHLATGNDDILRIIGRVSEYTANEEDTAVLSNFLKEKYRELAVDVSDLPIIRRLIDIFADITNLSGFLRDLKPLYKPLIDMLRLIPNYPEIVEFVDDFNNGKLIPLELKGSTVLDMVIKVLQGYLDAIRQEESPLISKRSFEEYNTNIKQEAKRVSDKITEDKIDESNFRIMMNILYILKDGNNIAMIKLRDLDFIFEADEVFARRLGVAMASFTLQEDKVLSDTLSYIIMMVGSRNFQK